MLSPNSLKLAGYHKVYNKYILIFYLFIKETVEYAKYDSLWK